ncbi:MAG: hypothetical protein QOI05_3089 [Bradyrhizobium sp.]|nr:hypothetical protein [Bradyrhizobium sp.]
MQGDLPAVLPGSAFDKPIRNQPVHEPDRSRMRQAEDPPELVIGNGAVANDDECGRGFAGAAYDVAGSLLDPIHHGERKRPQQIRDFRFRGHGLHNMCGAHKNQLD